MEIKLKIPFNKPSWSGEELKCISDAFAEGWVSGDGPFTKRVQTLLEGQLGHSGKVLLSTSCTHALEMAAILLELQPGDEVLVPSFTFVSTALAFVMHGAQPVFVDIRPDTLNLDEKKLEALITERTRAIVPVHYAGVGCAMDTIMAIADRYNLKVIEDNAHGLYGTYRGQSLGTIGHLATQSFHETKNIICGEGGALIVNDPCYIERAEIIREKGTNRSRFFRGEINKYSWIDKGSSYIMSDILAAFLYGQLQHAQSIQEKRRKIWERYFAGLEEWAKENKVRLPIVPDNCGQAYHMFYLLLPSLQDRDYFIAHLKKQGISSVFHYLPLHNSEMGISLGQEKADCPVTETVSNRLVRLPFYNDLDSESLDRIIREVTSLQFVNS